jgi:chitodextrinase
VFRGGVQVGTPTTTSFSDTNLTPSTAYSYTVAAVDAAGNVSAQSAAAGATTQAPPDTQAPSVPTNPTATAVSSTAIDLSWTASTDNVGVTEYRVFRDNVQVGTSTTTSFSDTNLTPSTAYSYTVAAVDAAGNVSAQSAAAGATTQAPPDTQAPSVPTNLTATAVSSTAIDLSWTASTDNVGVTEYRVIRDNVQVGTSTTTSFSDTNLTPATAYTYTIVAVDAALNASAPSAPVTGTTSVP